MAKKRKPLLLSHAAVFLSVTLHAMVTYVTVGNAAHWATLFPAGGIMDCGQFAANASQVAEEVMLEASLVIKHCLFLNCPTILINGGNVTFENVTFQGSWNLESRPRGGAISVGSNATLTLLRCSFRSCRSSDGGGALAVSAGFVYAENCTFHNSTANYGGSIWIADQSEFRCVDCDFHNSSAVRGGGAITVDGDSHLEISGGRFVGCDAGFIGGAIESTAGSNVYAKGTLFFLCTAGMGGCVITQDKASSFVCDECEFLNCTSKQRQRGSGGGAIVASEGAGVSLGRCRFLGCSSAKGVGGAMLVLDGSFVAAAESNFSHCFANKGGAIFLGGGESGFSCTDCHFRNAESSDAGGAIHVGGLKAALNLSRCVFQFCLSNFSEGGAILGGDASTSTAMHSSFQKCTARVGGSIYLENKASFRCFDCHFSQSRASEKGGAICTAGGAKLELNGCHFGSCSAVVYGGALLAELDSTITASACVFQACSAVYGGSTFAFHSKLRFNNCHFDSSFASKHGGAISILRDSDLRLNRSVLEHCSSGEDAGALSVADDSFALVDSCSFSKCSSKFGGSAQVNIRSGLYCINCNFTDSFASYVGGALHCETHTSLTLYDCEFRNCHAAQAGGGLVMASNSHALVSGSEFGNCSSSDGGSVFVGESTFRGNNTEFIASFAKQDGGAICVTGTASSLQLLECKIVGAKSFSSGGAIAIRNGRHTIISVTVENVTSNAGGAFHVSRAAEIILRNVSLRHATATTSHTQPIAGGGCISVDFHSLVSLHDSVFHGCGTVDRGGFAQVTGHSRLHVHGTLVSGSGAEGCCALVDVRDSQFYVYTTEFIGSVTAETHGGCASLSGPSSSMLCGGASVIQNCSSRQSGGAVMVLDGASLILDGCTLNDNVAHIAGGGILAVGPSLVTFSGNNTIRENVAFEGGGAVFLDGDARLVIINGSTTLTGNIATRCGSAIGLDNSGVSIEQLGGRLVVANHSGRGSLFCLTGRSPKLNLSSNLDNVLDGTVWVERATTAAELWRLNISQWLPDVQFFGPPRTVRIFDDRSGMDVRVGKPLPPFSARAIDAFGNDAWQPLSLTLLPIVRNESDCFKLANMPYTYHSDWLPEENLARFSDVFVGSGPGRYCFEVRAAPRTFPGHTEHFPWPQFEVEVLPCANDTEIFDEAAMQCLQVLSLQDKILRITLGACVLILASTVIVIVRKRVTALRRRTFARLARFLLSGEEISSLAKETADLIVPPALQLEYEREKWELAKSSLQFGRKLGEGEFGIVLQGKLSRDDDEDLDVAIKYPACFANSAHYEALIAELKAMANAGEHDNIVKLYGAVTVNLFKGELWVVMEMCECSLIDFIRNEAEIDGIRSPPTLALSLSICCGITAGMAYLSSRNIVHRDLAARNVLLDATASAKIADYGLARKMKRGYYRSKNAGKPVAMPAQWMALELLNLDPDSRFTTRTDVWSFGVVLWEVFSLGDEPYADIVDLNDANVTTQIQKYLLNGGRLHQPQYCPKSVYALIQQCWLADPSQRPSFEACGVLLQDFLDRVVELVS